MFNALFIKHKIIFLLFVLFSVVGGISLLLIHKGNEVFFFSSLHSSLLNQIFINITQIAETPGVIIFLILVALLNYRYLPVFLVNLIVLALVVTFLKHLVFANAMRPSILLADKGALNFVPGVEIMHNFSFPSGHTAAAFAMCFLFALLFKNTWLSFAMFTIATLVGISRLYLLQHFYEDVYAGAIVGMLISFVVYYGNEKWKIKRITI